jgi:hypothetical protein
VQNLRVRLLGEFQIEGCAPARLGRRQLRTLIKILALHHGQPVSTDRLVDYLWGDHPPPGAIDQISVLVSRARSVVGTDRIQRTDRAYLMKEQLRIAIRTKGVLALTMLDEWLIWVQRCRIGAFVELGRKTRKNIAGIEAAMVHNLSNALIESTSTKLRVLHRMAFGFRQPEHLIALALLDRGGYCPPLPGPGALISAGACGAWLREPWAWSPVG